MFDNAEFVVESTPVAGQAPSAPAPKPSQTTPFGKHEKEFEELGIHPSDVSSGFGDTSWEEDHTEVITDLDSLEVGEVMFVDADGNEYPIQQFPYTIGRTVDCDLVLEGRGISRRHAEVIYQSGRFIINDLKSLNGIRVNGFKVARVLLEDSDEIKIGDATLHFSYVGDETDSQSELDEKPRQVKFSHYIEKIKSKSKIVAGGVGVFVLVVSAWFGFLGSNNRDVGEIASSADLSASSGNPVVTSDTSQHTVPGTPSVGNATVPLANKMDESIAFVFEVEDDPGERFIVDKKIVIAPKRVEALIPKAADKIIPPKPFRSTASNKKANEILETANKKYMRGDAPLVIQDLKDAQKLKGLSKTTASKLSIKRRQLEVLYAAYKKGNDTYRSGNKKDSFEQWTSFLEKEKSTLKTTRKSVYSMEIASRVMQEYVDQGAAARDSGNHHEAYRLWQRALEVGDSIEAKVAISNVELKSKQLYRKGLRLEYVNSEKARDAWAMVVEMVPPGTEYYTKANSKIAWYTQWSVH